MKNCLFCKIINKDIPAKIVYEDDICIAFLDISQTTKGHTLVIPKEHFDNYLDVDSKTLGHMSSVAQKIALLIQDKLGAEGFNFVSNTHEIAGQSVPHFHIHIIPRYTKNDTFDIQYFDHSKDCNLDDILKELQ